MKKFRSKKGFTLVELLVSAMLLGFVSLLVTVITSAVLNSTTTMTQVAHAEILGSEALTNMQNELRFTNIVATDLKVSVQEKGSDGENLPTAECLVFKYSSKTSGGNAASVQYGLGKYNGKIYLGAVKEDKEENIWTEPQPLFDGVSYDNGNLKISELKFVPEEETDSTGKGTGKIKAVGIEVSVSFGAKILWSGSVSVRPISGLSPNNAGE